MLWKKNKKKTVNKETFMEMVDDYLGNLKELDDRIVIDLNIDQHKDRKSAYALKMNITLEGWAGPRVMYPKNIKHFARMDIDLEKIDTAQADSFLSKWFGRLSDLYRNYLHQEEVSTADVSYIH